MDIPRDKFGRFLKGFTSPNREGLTSSCLNCGKVFNTIKAKLKVGKGKFCSQTCSNRYWADKKIKGNSICIECGDGYHAKGTRQRFCSHRCWHKYRVDNSLTPFSRGKRHINWCGGISNKPYPVDWTNTLRISIRERDMYTCQICGELQGDTALSIHHIDYNKENCNIDNLISLCRSCHNKTNHNREYWIKYFGGLNG